MPADIQSRWIENAQTRNHLLAYEFHRKFKPCHAIGVRQVHGFCEGDEKAYEAVIFLPWELPNGSYKCVPVPDQVLHCPFERENYPETGRHGLLNPYKDV